MPIVSQKGVVGYAIHPKLLTSTVLLITNNYVAVDALVQRSRVRGLVQGEDEAASLKYVKRDSDIVVGDKVITSGLNKLFPKGLRIGTVAEIQKEEYEPEQKVKITPSASLSTLEEVFVVLKTSAPIEKIK